MENELNKEDVLITNSTWTNYILREQVNNNYTNRLFDHSFSREVQITRNEKYT